MSLVAATPRRSAVRCLFGRENKEESRKWLNEQLEKIRIAAETKWGFDFHHEHAIPGSSSDYVFSPVDPTTVPEFYKPKHVLTATLPLARAESPVSSVGCSSDESDTSMDTSISPLPPSRRFPATPKKRNGHQVRLTDFMKVQKRLRRSPKNDDITERRSRSTSSSPIRG